MILFIAATIYAVRIEGTKKQIITFLKTVFILGGLIGIVAFINEHVTKELIRQPRPSHLFLVEKNQRITIDSLYKVDTEKRRGLLQELITDDSLRLKNIDPDVLTHWIEEAGYSFPSGHSFNVFLLSVVISWTMFHSRIKWVNHAFWIPSVWALLVALSRVAIGAHSAWDVSFGAALGILLGYTFLHFDTTRKWITHRDSE